MRGAPAGARGPAARPGAHHGPLPAVAAPGPDGRTRRDQVDRPALHALRGYRGHGRRPGGGVRGRHREPDQERSASGGGAGHPARGDRQRGGALLRHRGDREGVPAPPGAAALPRLPGRRHAHGARDPPRGRRRGLPPLGVPGLLPGRRGPALRALRRRQVRGRAGRRGAASAGGGHQRGHRRDRRATPGRPGGPRPGAGVVRGAELGRGQDPGREGRDAGHRQPGLHHGGVRRLVPRRRALRHRHAPDPDRVPARQ